MNSLQLRGLWQLVRLLPTHNETAAGIALPESYWSNNSTAIVLQSGPGLDLDGRGVLPPVAQPGDLVLFDMGDFHPLKGEEGFVWDPKLAAWLACDTADSRNDRPVPLGEWVLVEPDAAPERAGSILLTERAKHPYSGIVLDTGTGRLITHGANRGRRLDVAKLCGHPVDGHRVHWRKDVQTLFVGRQRLQWQLLKAQDLTVAECSAHA